MSHKQSHHFNKQSLGRAIYSVGFWIRALMSPSRSTYQKRLAEACNMHDRTRILAFKNKPPTPVELFPKELLSPPPLSKSAKPKRCIPQTSERTLDAPDILDDFYLNLLDWGSSNVVSIALENTVYLWNASDSSTSELVTVDDDDGPVTSVSWAPDGRHLAIGLNNSHVQLWDTTASKQLRAMKGGHRARVGSLAWNNHILTTGGMDGKVVNKSEFRFADSANRTTASDPFATTTAAGGADEDDLYN